MKQARIFFLAFFLFSTSSSFAGGVKDHISEIESRTLIVIIESPLKSQLNKLNVEEKTAYEKAVDNYNRKLKEVTDKFWEINTKKEFKTWDEVNDIIKKGEENYVLLYAGNYSSESNATGLMQQKGLKFYPTIFAESEKRDYGMFYTSFRLCLLEDFKRNKSIVTRNITNLWPLKEDIVFVCQYIQCLLIESKRMNSAMDVSDVAATHKTDFKNSILLLKSNLVNDGIIATKKATAYPYEFEIVSHDSLLYRIFNTQNVLYVEIVPRIVGTGEAFRLGYEHIVMNAQTGMIVAYVPVNSGILHATAGLARFDKYISQGSFAKYLQEKNIDSSPVQQLAEPKE